MKTKNIPLHKLADIIQFLADNTEKYDIWGSNVTMQSVYVCMESGTFEETPYSVWQITMHESDVEYNHAARIAYLIKNIDTTPIELDVGCPSLGYYDINLIDGNHRAVAAIIRGDKTIKGYVGGEIGYYNHLFVKKSKKYTDI